MRKSTSVLFLASVATATGPVAALAWPYTCHPEGSGEEMVLDAHTLGLAHLGMYRSVRARHDGRPLQILSRIRCRPSEDGRPGDSGL